MDLATAILEMKNFTRRDHRHQDNCVVRKKTTEFGVQRHRLKRRLWYFLCGLEQLTDFGKLDDHTHRMEIVSLPGDHSYCEDHRT